MIDDALAGKKQIKYADNDDPGQKVRQINDRLNDPLEGDMFQLIQQKRQQNRQRKIENQMQQVNHKCISEQNDKIVAGKKPDKMFEPDPGTVPETGIGRKIFECDQYPPHRHIFEQKKKQESRKR